MIDKPVDVDPSSICSPLLNDGRDDLLCRRQALKWQHETGVLLLIGFPIGLSSFCRMLMAVCDISVLGRLDKGTEYLAAAAMAWVVMDISSVFPSTGADTINSLCSQAYGAKNMSLVGRYLQLGLIITTVMCIPVMIIWALTGRILLIIGCDPDIAALANSFAVWSCFGLIPNTMYYSVRQYFQAQKIVLPALYNNMAFVAINLILNIVLVHGCGNWPGLGFIGSPIATSLSRTLQLLSFVLYTCTWKKLHLKTWPEGPLLDCLTKPNFKVYMGQTVPAMLGNAAEQWQLEAVTLMAASLGSVDVATQAAVFNIFYALHCLSFGLAKATTCRVGYHLGAGNPLYAQQSAAISILLATIIGFVIAVILFAARSQIGHTFSNDPAVWADSSSLVTVLAISYVGISVLIALTAILFGQCRPGPVAIISGLCSWFLSLPLAFFFAFRLRLGLNGLWLGLSCGYFTIVLLIGTVVYRSNWHSCAYMAMKRSKRCAALVVEADV